MTPSIGMVFTFCLCSQTQIHVGVFDYDEFIPGMTTGPAGKHDKIGKSFAKAAVPPSTKDKQYFTFDAHLRLARLA